MFLAFSGRTSSVSTQQALESKLTKKATVLVPPIGKRAIVMVDDVNMPMAQEHGAQPPVELLRQFLDYGGFYDRQKHTWRGVQDTALGVAAAPAGGGRYPLSPRFTRHFTVLCMPKPSNAAMNTIFSELMQHFLAPFLPEIRTLAPCIVHSTIEVYNRVSNELRPTPSKFHYTFNLRDVSRLVQGAFGDDCVGCWVLGVGCWVLGVGCC